MKVTAEARQKILDICRNERVADNYVSTLEGLPIRGNRIIVQVEAPFQFGYWDFQALPLDLRKQPDGEWALE